MDDLFNRLRNDGGFLVHRSQVDDIHFDLPEFYCINFDQVQSVLENHKFNRATVTGWHDEFNSYHITHIIDGDGVWKTGIRPYRHRWARKDYLGHPNHEDWNLKRTATTLEMIARDAGLWRETVRFEHDLEFVNFMSKLHPCNYSLVNEEFERHYNAPGQVGRRLVYATALYREGKDDPFYYISSVEDWKFLPRSWDRELSKIGSMCMSVLTDFDITHPYKIPQEVYFYWHKLVDWLGNDLADDLMNNRYITIRGE